MQKCLMLHPFLAIEFDSRTGIAVAVNHEDVNFDLRLAVQFDMDQNTVFSRDVVDSDLHGL